MKKAFCGAGFRLMLTVGLLFFSSDAAAVTLSPHAETIGKSIQFDRRVLVMLTEQAGGGIQRMAGYNEHGFQVIVDGVFVSVDEKKTESVLNILRKKLAPLKYMAFIIDKNGTIKTDKIGVLKGSDQYDIVRVMHTDGTDYNVSYEHIIHRLKEWEKSARFAITGAGRNWIEIKFRELPKDILSFAEDVNCFCPNIVERGAGDITGLARELKQTRRLVLSWE